MASSLNKEKTIDEMIDEHLAKYRAMADRDQERIVELEERNTYLADSIRSGLVVPATGFVVGYARGYYGDKGSVLGISLDAAAGMLFTGLAALFGCSSNKGVQTAAKLCGDIAHGALACWAAATGAELGLKKRMEKPALPPAPKPITGAQDMPLRAPRPLTHEELAALKADMPQRAPSPLSHEELAAFAAFKSKLAMQEQPPVPTQTAPPWQSPAPPAPKTNPLPEPTAPARAHAPQSLAQSPVPPKTNPLSKAEAVAPKAPPQSPAPQQPRCNTQQCPSANAESAPEARSTREKPFRFTQRGQVDGESGLTTLLRSFGIPPISETPNWPNWPSTQTSIENFDRILRMARAPA